METIEKAKELMKKAYDLDKHNKTPQGAIKWSNYFGILKKRERS